LRVSRFNLSLMVVTYFLPMSLLTATYTTIGRELWGQQAIGEATEVQRESIKSKRRVRLFLKLQKEKLAKKVKYSFGAKIANEKL